MDEDPLDLDFGIGRDIGFIPGFEDMPDLVDSDDEEEAELDFKVDEAVRFGKAEIKKLQELLGETIRQTWHTQPPKNLGDPGHGKLKADQWQSLMEFDIPVSLAQMWVLSKKKRSQDEGSHKHKMFTCTMFLACAICWVTSHKTSSLHVERYTHFMYEYLKTLLELLPDLKLRPNHHNAFHLGEFLLLFGPIHGWWAYAFERVVGVLQNFNTNYKIGAYWPEKLSF